MIKIIKILYVISGVVALVNIIMVIMGVCSHNLSASFGWLSALIWIGLAYVNQKDIE